MRPSTLSWVYQSVVGLISFLSASCSVHKFDNGEHGSVWKFSACTDKHLSAWGDHLWGPGELLAVQSQGSQVLIDGHLGGVCASLEHTDASLRHWDGGDDVVHVSVDVSLVDPDGHVVLHDVLLSCGHVHLQQGN